MIGSTRSEDFDGPPAEVNATTIRNPRGGSDGTRTYLLRQPHDSHNEVGRRVACASCPKMRTERCLRCLLLVMCTHPFAKKALTPHLARSEGHERYFGCNLMHRKVLASSHQHLMAEAPNFSRLTSHAILRGRFSRRTSHPFSSRRRRTPPALYRIRYHFV